MITPLEERRNPGDYVNRIKHTEHGHSPGSRDFSYEIGEVSDEQQHKHEPSHEFGEDVYEHSDGAPEQEPETRHGTGTSDDSSLDITI